MSIFKSLVLWILGLLIVFVLIFSMTILDSGGNIMARLWKFEVPNEVTSVNSNININDKDLILQFINKCYKDGKLENAGGNAWYPDSCIDNYLLDYKVHSFLKLDDFKIYFVVKLSQNANKCLEKSDRSDNIIELVPFFISNTNKCFLIGNKDKRGREHYYNLTTLQTDNYLYKLFCDAKIIRFLKSYNYYWFNFLGLNFKSDQFAKNVENDLWK